MQDGSVRHVRARGDENFNWTEDEAGFAVTRGDDGRWQYARREKGRWMPAGMKPVQSGAEGYRQAPPVRAQAPSRVATAGAQLSSGSSAVASAGPASGAGLLSVSPAQPVPLLVLLVAFTNRSLTYASSVWSNEVFGTTGKTVNAFYREASNGRYWFTPAAESEGVASDGVIRVSLSINHPNTGSATPDDTVRAAVKAAFQAADPYINYQAYDRNADGALDNTELQLLLIFAGYEAAYNSPPSPSVWAHETSLLGTVPAPLLDGVTVGGWPDGYAVVGEIHYNPNHPATIGIICHEMGHNLKNWLDLYDIDGTSDGVGYHCLMGLGNWGKATNDTYLGETPVLPCAYLRLVAGFSDVQDVVGTGRTYTATEVSNATSSYDVVRLVTTNAQQYFLVENRRLSGFDTGLYKPFAVSTGGGLAVWHIDESASDNATDARRRVDLEEAANASLDAAGGNQGLVTHYFYAGNRTNFNASTSPGSALYGGGASQVSITNVSAAGPAMTFTAGAGANPPVVSLGTNAQSLSFLWTGGVSNVVFWNSGNLPLAWSATSAVWCAASPTNGTLAVGATQQVAVACATNVVRMVPRASALCVWASDGSGTAAANTPFVVPLSQAARPADPATIFSVR